MMSYLRPAETTRTFTLVSNSRFVTSIGIADSTAKVKEFLHQVRAEMPDATHHAYAFRVGFGNSTTEGMSDDGEPSGTAGPPILSVIRGAAIGDIIVVVTRYFGGTKLGTGGLVRAYKEATQTALKALKTEEKVLKKLVGIETPYTLFPLIKHLASKHGGSIQDETFQQSVTLFIEFRADDVGEFSRQVLEATSGQIVPLILNDD